ncbi:hypothetical protein TRP8649_03871 [Pelagimonas phthalicica]|uniref:TIR domain-containing protein n=1 Tax=Pelagimonas phthalicica TaxID=1037362 RepID=A0A238JIF8_9RHOB|nr:TIR domain-containing protein [Pelagimonas phthalicica]TDS89093.1 TIR domain-containing protein [Pelagimonas phthalicica]SMX29732.1 hypothetical protein TRP8649_03871 [Pelagimonas phthalicica]
MSDSTKDFRIFISHKHQDTHLAKKLHEILHDKWLGGNGKVFLSSLPGSGKQGKNLNTELTEELRRTDLFILLFTDADEDWSNCMWELGVATGSQTKATRVVTLYCGNKQPLVRISDLTVSVRDDKEVADFAANFHGKDGWLIKDEGTRESESALLSYLGLQSEDEVNNRAMFLHEELSKFINDSSPEWIERLEYLKFSLERSHVESVIELREKAQKLSFVNQDHIDFKKLEDEDKQKHQALRQEYDSLRTKATMLLQSELVLSPDGPLTQGALNRFGYTVAPKKATLKDLFRNWEDDYRSNHNGHLDEDVIQWQAELLSDLSRATEGRSSRPSRFAMPATSSNNSEEVLPVVVRTRSKVDGSVVYFVYFFRAPEDYSANAVYNDFLEETLADLTDDLTKCREELNNANLEIARLTNETQ